MSACRATNAQTSSAVSILLCVMALRAGIGWGSPLAASTVLYVTAQRPTRHALAPDGLVGAKTLRKGIGKHRRKPAKPDDGREISSSLRFPRGLNREPPCQKRYHMKNLRLALLRARAVFPSPLPRPCRQRVAMRAVSCATVPQAESVNGRLSSPILSQMLCRHTCSRRPSRSGGHHRIDVGGNRCVPARVSGRTGHFATVGLLRAAIARGASAQNLRRVLSAGH
jgi:hypothetical protein